MKIAIASGKGGTGKTTISVNLVSLLAEENNILLADLDVEEPNSGLFLHGELHHYENKFKMKPQWIEQNCTLCGKCQQVCNFNAIIKLGSQIIVFSELCHSCYACSELCPTNSLPMHQQKMGVLKHFKKNEIDFIESRLDIGQEQAVPLIAQTIDYVKQQCQKHQLIIFDSPPGTSCPVIEVIKNSDFVLLITEPTPFGLNDLKLAVETVRELKKDFAVVINRSGIGDNKVAEYCLKENIRILANIPNSRSIAELYAQGKIIYQKINSFESEIRKVADYILNLHTDMKA